MHVLKRQNIVGRRFPIQREWIDQVDIKTHVLEWHSQVRNVVRSWLSPRGSEASGESEEVVAAKRILP